MRLADIMLPEFDREMARTRKLLAAIPADRIDYQAHPGLHTVAWNANHLADILGWAEAIVNFGEFDMEPVGGPKYETPNVKDPAAILATFDKNVAAARAAIAGASDEKLAEPWSLKAAGHTLFTVPKGECLRTWVLNHSIHHRAILSVCLRMAGVEVTPVYDG